MFKSSSADPHQVEEADCHLPLDASNAAPRGHGIGKILQQGDR